MTTRIQLGEGIEYIRRTDGFTLRVLSSDLQDAEGTFHDIHMSDDLFGSLVILQERYRNQLNHVDGDGFAEGGWA